MRAEFIVHTAAWLLGSGVLILVASYWVFAPMLARLNGDRFAKEAGPLAEAEAEAWRTFHETGTFPGVDAEVLRQPGWENARLGGKVKAFR